MTNYDGGTTLSVKKAIDLLNPIVKAPNGIFTQNEKIALSMAISALEKEKEPQPEQADKDSSKNNFINNDNTKLRECQEIIDDIVADLLDYYDNWLSSEEKKAWKLCFIYQQAYDAKILFEEENK